MKTEDRRGKARWGYQPKHPSSRPALADGKRGLTDEPSILTDDIFQDLCRRAEINSAEAGDSFREDLETEFRALRHTKYVSETTVEIRDQLDALKYMCLDAVHLYRNMRRADWDTRLAVMNTYPSPANRPGRRRTTQPRERLMRDVERMRQLTMRLLRARSLKKRELRARGSVSGNSGGRTGNPPFDLACLHFAEFYKAHSRKPFTISPDLSVHDADEFTSPGARFVEGCLLVLYPGTPITTISNGMKKARQAIRQEQAVNQQV